MCEHGYDIIRELHEEDYTLNDNWIHGVHFWRSFLIEIYITNLKFLMLILNIESY